MLPEQFYHELGLIILDARNRRGMSRKSLTDATGFHSTSIRRMESGEHLLKLHEAIVLDNILEFGLFDFMEKWGAEFAKPPEEVEIAGRKYRLVG